MSGNARPRVTYQRGRLAAVSSRSPLRRLAARLVVAAAGLALLGALLPASTVLATSGFGAPVVIGVESLGVSCTAPTDCTAVGSYGVNGGYITETNGTWGLDTALPGPSASGGFTAVSCTAAGDCTAVGNDTNGAAYATESNGTWGPFTEVSAPYAGFNAVSCTAAGDCTTVGWNSGPGIAAIPAYATETDGIWGPITEVPLTFPESDGRFIGVSL